MASGSKVVLNQRVFGEQVMSSQGMAEQLRPHADAIAAQIPGAKTRWIVTPAAGGGSRGRWRIEVEHTRANQTRQRLVNAMRAVMGRAG